MENDHKTFDAIWRIVNCEQDLKETYYAKNKLNVPAVLEAHQFLCSRYCISDDDNERASVESTTSPSMHQRRTRNNNVFILYSTLLHNCLNFDVSHCLNSIEILMHIPLAYFGLHIEDLLIPLCQLINGKLRVSEKLQLVDRLMKYRPDVFRALLLKFQSCLSRIIFLSTRFNGKKILQFTGELTKLMTLFYVANQKSETRQSDVVMYDDDCTTGAVEETGRCREHQSRGRLLVPWSLFYNEAVNIHIDLEEGMHFMFVNKSALVNKNAFVHL